MIWTWSKYVTCGTFSQSMTSFRSFITATQVVVRDADPVDAEEQLVDRHEDVGTAGARQQPFAADEVPLLDRVLQVVVAAQLGILAPLLPQLPLEGVLVRQVLRVARLLEL